MAFNPFTPLELSLLERTHRHQVTSNPQTEILFCVTEDGLAMIDHAIGAPDHVHLTTAMKAHLCNGNRCRLIHNHPKEGSLSSADWRLCVNEPGISEIVAINSNRSIFRASVLDPTRLSPLVDLPSGPQWDRATEAIEVAVCNTFKISDPDAFHLVNVITWTASDIANQRLLALGLINYEATYGAADSKLLREPELTDLLSDGGAAARLHLP